MAVSSSTAASTSSDSNSNSNSSFDVFINHHGLDVKKTFASHLYQRLRPYGLKVFLDQQESQRGDYFTSQIKGAIQAASVHVAIFSERYAESTWCLDELLWMLESKAFIIPVFYQVKPNELKWTRGKDGRYAQALHKHQVKTTDDSQNHEKRLRHDPATVEQWREALKNFSLISGFELKECNDDEGILLNKVIESVLTNVKKPLDVAKYPTGLDEKMTEFENEVLLPHLQSGRKPQILGIVGLGGAGKTTLAKELFNRKSPEYSKCCFLSDVRENVNKGSLISLQSNLLKKISGTVLQIHNKDEAIEMLKYHLSSQQILLILDDVDKVDQVDALVPNQTSIHSNSLILITSRDKDILTRSGVEKSSIYKLNGLNEQHSMELFCWHAFRQSYSLQGFEDLTLKFVKACNGLPLSLKVFGALLYGNNDIDYWKEQLDKLERILPNEIQERLRISYEILDVEQKKIFLDIACFLIGENRDTAIRIWNGSGWGGRSGFQTLENKSLVEVGYGNVIHMHDHLRDLGRVEAHVSQPLRFWRVDDLLQQSSAVSVRGIRMVLSEYDDDEAFDGIEIRRLQLVDTEGILLERILSRAKSPDLIWLCWKECPYSSLPDWNISMKKLTVLRVSGRTLETLWQPNSPLPVCLEELRVDGCHHLKSIQGLAHLTKLQLLSLRWCIELEELPSMETLVSLEYFWANQCAKLKSIRGLEHARKLRLLSVSGCTELEELPDMEKLVSLEELMAYGCVKLKSIRGLEQATKLRRLTVSRCTVLGELPNMETWVSLEDLRAHGCVKLKSIRGLEQATKLKQLNVNNCTELEELPSMETLVSLENFSAYKCAKLKSIRGLEHTTKLQRLDVAKCTDLEELPNMEKLVSLEELWARGCGKLKSIRGLEHATKLRQLSVSKCTELEELPNMEKLVSLEELMAYGSVKLKSIRGLEQATKLEHLDVRWCFELEEVEGVEQRTWLKKLDVRGCPKLQCPVWE